ncbi:unnamed protein product [Larinioides sclopetarius]|uniref:Uncharacterized protein n=1 Tax=Larinioides sclopetarius TaxID=280406 RepID=A0AAV2BJJ1_9ARAC
MGQDVCCIIDGLEMEEISFGCNDASWSDNARCSSAIFLQIFNAEKTEFTSARGIYVKVGKFFPLKSMGIEQVIGYKYIPHRIEPKNKWKNKPEVSEKEDLSMRRCIWDSSANSTWRQYFQILAPCSVRGRVSYLSRRQAAKQKKEWSPFVKSDLIKKKIEERKKRNQGKWEEYRSLWKWCVQVQKFKWVRSRENGRNPVLHLRRNICSVEIGQDGGEQTSDNVASIQHDGSVCHFQPWAVQPYLLRPFKPSGREDIFTGRMRYTKERRRDWIWRLMAHFQQL